MMLLLVAGIALLAMSALQVARPRVAADRDRRRALDRVRASADVATAAGTDGRRSIFGRVANHRVHDLVEPRIPRCPLLDGRVARALWHGACEQLVEHEAQIA